MGRLANAQFERFLVDVADIVVAIAFDPGPAIPAIEHTQRFTIKRLAVDYRREIGSRPDVDDRFDDVSRLAGHETLGLDLSLESLLGEVGTIGE